VCYRVENQPLLMGAILVAIGYEFRAMMGIVRGYMCHLITVDGDLFTLTVVDDLTIPD